MVEGIAIDKEKLERLISRFCPYYYPMDGGDVCSKAVRGKCNIDFIGKIELNCPHDCPHRNEYKWKKCKHGKCDYVKKKIKEIEL